MVGGAGEGWGVLVRKSIEPPVNKCGPPNFYGVGGAFVVAVDYFKRGRCVKHPDSLTVH